VAELFELGGRRLDAPDDDIEAAQRFCSSIDGRNNLVLLGHVGGHENGLTSERLDLGGDVNQAGTWVLAVDPGAGVVLMDQMAPARSSSSR
jgi:hypothetical protein